MLPNIIVTTLAEQTHVFPMADNNALPADEILGTYGNIDNFCLDLPKDPPDEDEEVTLVHPSPYYGANRLSAGLSHPHQLNVLSLNAQSLYAIFDQFAAFLEIARQQNIRFHVICIQESWLGRTSNLSSVQIDGYNCFYRDKRPECSNHGGLITYVDDNFEANDLCIRNESSVWENLFVQIKGTGHSRDIILGNVYNPPKDNNSIDNIQIFTSELAAVLFSLKNTNSEVELCGDYNINILKLECRLSFEEFLESMLSNSFYPQVTLPTRLDRNICTLIDYISMKLSSSYKDRTAGIIFTRISDNFPCFLVLRWTQMSTLNECSLYKTTSVY